MSVAAEEQRALRCSARDRGDLRSGSLVGGFSRDRRGGAGTELGVIRAAYRLALHFISTAPCVDVSNLV